MEAKFVVRQGFLWVPALALNGGLACRKTRVFVGNSTLFDGRRIPLMLSFLFSSGRIPLMPSSLFGGGITI